ncbi:hypothetical protein BS78_03G147200 [Paspalum vaginatum]|nr:hypothetical protein BS78_03G147200 [Paspalum vaginatum]
MVISFRFPPRRRSLYLPPPPSASSQAVDDSRPRAAASLVGQSPHPRPVCDAAVSLPDTGIAAGSELPDRNGIVPMESDLQPSFVLNLFPDGYSVGEPGKGMLLYLIGDDPKKLPYSRASKASLSDIEHGYLPQDILHSIPCKFLNGSTMCEVRDYRSVFSNGHDCSGDDFPRVNRVHLRLGTECVVKDLSYIADASWTYHDQLTAESMILNALQPRLNLDPIPCLEKLCNSSTKKIDLGLNNRRLESKDISVVVMSTNPPENCKPKEFNTCKGATLCNGNTALEGTPNGLKKLLVKCPSTLHVNCARSAVKSDTNNTSQPSYTLPNSSTLCDRCNEQWGEVEILQVDPKTGQRKKVTVLPQKTGMPLNLLHEKHESEKCSPANKNGRLSSQNSEGLHKSMSSSSKEELNLGSQEIMQGEADIGQAIDNKYMKVQKLVPLSVPPRDSYTSLNTNDPYIWKIPEKVKLLHIGMKEQHVAPISDQNNSDIPDVNESGTPLMISFHGCSRRAACERLEDISAMKSQGTSPKRKASEISVISLNKEINLRVKRQQNVDTQLKPNRSLEEPTVSSQLAIGQELYKGRQQSKGTSLYHTSSDAPENCMPNEFNFYKVAAVCSEYAALEAMESAVFNNSPLNYPSSIRFNNAKSAVESDLHSTIRSSSTPTNSSAVCDRKQTVSITPAPDHLPQCNEERANVTVLQTDCENRQPERVIVLPQKRKRHGSKNNSPPIKTARVSSQKFKEEKSGSNEEGLHLGAPQGSQVVVKVDQTIGNKDMKVHKQVPLAVHSRSHLCTSSNACDPYVEKIPEKVKSLHIRLKEHHEAPIAGPKKSDMADLRDGRSLSVISFTASSSKAVCESGKDKAATGPQLNSLNRNVTGISTISLNQEIDLNGQSQQKLDIQIKTPCDNIWLEDSDVTGGVNTKFGISTHLQSCYGHPINNSEPDIEKILSEVILTTRRHGLDEKSAKSDVLETSWLLQPYEFFQSENVVEIPHIRDETMTYHVSDAATSAWKSRRLTFRPSQSSSCLVDKSQYTLCLLESKAPDNHQITVGTINGDEHIHIATLPTSCHAEKFVDQFISLMKRDGYSLCNDDVCNEPSDLRQQSEDVSHLGYPTGEDVQYLIFSPTAANSLPIGKNTDVDCTFQNGLHANLVQRLTQQWILAEQPPSTESPEAFFLNPSHLSGGLQDTSQFLQDQDSSFSCYPYALDPLQVPYIQPSLGIPMDQYLQCRDDILGFIDMHGDSMMASRYSQLWQEVSGHDLPGLNGTYGASTSARRYNQWRQDVPMDQYPQYRYDIPGMSDTYSSSMSVSSYGQWRQVYTRMGNVVYQWDLPVFGRNIQNNPPVHDGWSVTLSRAAADQEPSDELPECGL